MIYATGRLAIEFGILPWDGMALFAAAMACEAAHIALYDGALGVPSRGAAPSRDPLDALRLHVRRHRVPSERVEGLIDLRNGLLEHGLHDHARCPGYIHRGRDGTTELLFSEATLLRVCGNGARVARLKQELDAAGFLRRDLRRPSVRRSIYEDRRPEERVQVIAVAAAAFRGRPAS